MASIGKKYLVVTVVVAALVVLGALLLQRKSQEVNAIRLGIAPYQDLAMIVNAGPLRLEQRYGTRLDLITMSWEDILPAVASAGRALDMGFGGYVEFLTKYESINANSSDPVLFIYPAYAFRGGAFISYDRRVPVLDRAVLADSNSSVVRRWLSYRIGAQRGSVYEMMLLDLARRSRTDFEHLRLFDTPLDQGFLAAEHGSLDIATAGLTQLTEARRRGARSVLTMDDLGLADLTGFIVKKSVYDRRRRDVENVIRMWFDCVAYVLKDVDHNSAVSLTYLDRNASTRYTLEEYKSALGQEYFPTTPEEARAQLIEPGGRFSAIAIGQLANEYLLQRRSIQRPSPLPAFATIATARP